MKISYTVKNYKVAKSFKEILEKKLKKLDKYFDDEVAVKIGLKAQNDSYTLEVTINSNGLFFRSEVTSDNMYNNIDTALPKIEKQIIKNSEKFKSKMRKDSFSNNLFVEGTYNEKPSNLMKTKRFEIEPMTIEEAECRMEALGHDFFVYLNVYTNEVNIVYTRRDGNIGNIEVVY